MRMILGLSSLVAVAALAVADSSRDVAVVDADGFRVIRASKPIDSVGQPPVLPAIGLLWQASDPIAIAESICLSDTMNETWVGWNLNSERGSLYQTTGTGTAVFSYDLLPENPDAVVVASAENVSLGVVMSVRPGGPVAVRGFTAANGNIPIWTYTFPAPYFNSYHGMLAVSADGTRVIAIAREIGVANSMIVVLNGANGAVLNSTTTAVNINGVDISESGARAVLTESANGRVIDTNSLATLHSFSVSGGGGFHRISRDGNTVAAGGFDLKAWRFNGATWPQILTFSGGQQWFGNGIGIAGDGSRLFNAAFVYTTYLTVNYRVFDLSNGSVIASTSTTGTGTFQDTVVRAQASYDGQYFASASWGTADNVHPEVQIWSANLTLLGGIDSPGSPFSLDMSRNGCYVVAGTKAVHANTFGSGGVAYAYEACAVAPCPEDCTGDGQIDQADLALLLSCYNGGPCCDIDGDGDTDQADLAAMLAVYGQACP